MNFLHRRAIKRCFFYTRQVNSMNQSFSDSYYYGVYFGRWGSSAWLWKEE